MLAAGLLTPFRRDQKSDFAHGADEALVRSCVAQVLGTECSMDDGSASGELPWRPEFGSVLYRLRQRPNDETTRQLAKFFVADALRRWEPRVRLTDVSFIQQKIDPRNIGGPDALFIRVKYDIIKANVPGNNVVLPGVTQDIKV